MTTRLLYALVGVVMLVSCSRGDGVPGESIGQRLHRECTSIIAAALSVEDGIDLTAGAENPKAWKAQLIQTCILARGGVRGGNTGNTE